MYDLTEEVYEVLLDDFNTWASLYYEMHSDEGVSGKDLPSQPLWSSPPALRGSMRDSHPHRSPIFIMSTTTELKPRPIRKRPTKMNEQQPKVTITKQTPITLTKVQSHLPDIQLIDRNALWEDFKNRLKINNYEVKQAMADLKGVVEASQPYVDKVVTKVKEVTNR